NSAMGMYALYFNTTGYSNSAMGVSALSTNTTGARNSAMGAQAGQLLADGSANQTSSRSVFLGYDTRASVAGGNNEIVIGASAIGAGSNSVVLGNDSITKTLLKGNVGIGMTSPSEKLDVNGNVRAHEFYYSSDASLKMGIGYLPGEEMLSKVLQLQGVSFNWKATGEKSIGFIAQDVEKIFPEAVATDANGLKSISYSKLIAPLTEAIKEQQKQIEFLMAEIEQLKQ
ncbi:MAG TPA: tail fiber domain-containing protein, partial [Candidatus Pacearchaeota archaeon]|nr:tail fiber domain-containing protein [Candidatus Pacearchaeota archaeon]